MLVVKPLLLYKRFKQDQKAKYGRGGDVELDRVASPYNEFIEDNRVSNFNPHPLQSFSDEEVK